MSGDIQALHPSLIVSLITTSLNGREFVTSFLQRHLHVQMGSPQLTINHSYKFHQFSQREAEDRLRLEYVRVRIN